MRVVISSSWRFFHSDEELRALFGVLGARIAGTTTLEHEARSRTDEILQHAEKSGHPRFLALDDDGSVRERERKEDDQRFMWCSPETGISPRKVLVRLHARLLELHADIPRER